MPTSVTRNGQIGIADVLLLRIWLWLVRLLYFEPAVATQLDAFLSE
jgi:hypothetical protein